jgi:hypothetical protein
MIKKILITAASLLMVLGVAGILSAGHHYHGCSGMMNGDLLTMDKDNDGFVDMDEFTDPHMVKYGRWFKMLDTDEDGFLSQEEWDEFRRNHGFEESSKS